MSKIIKTKHFKSIFTNEEATDIFKYLRDNVEWVDSFKSKGRVTRKAASYNLKTDPNIEQIVKDTINRTKLTGLKIYGFYMNYYRNGNDFTPNHSHDTKQIVLSFNEEDGDRTLLVGKKEYHLNNGDIILFGKSSHGIPKEANKKGRISIAMFADPVDSGEENIFLEDPIEISLSNLIILLNNMKSC